MKKMNDFVLLITLTVFLTFIIWLPHLLAAPNFWGLSFQNGFNTIYRNFDGLEYIVIAKTYYQPGLIASLPLSLPAGYFASHFPGYSLLINVFAPLLGYLKSMLFVSLFSTILAACIFYKLVKDFNLSTHPLFLSILFLILPARWVIVHSVGSSEPLFILLIILSVYFFMKYETEQKFQFILLTGVFGLFAQLTRPPGILLFIALSLYLVWKILKTRMRFVSIIRIIGLNTPLLLIPAGLLLIFYWYALTYGNFFAYFQSGDNIHLNFPPFGVFNKNQFWVGDIWLEDLIYIFILGFLGAVSLFKRGLYPMAYFVLIYFIASTLIAHRDISRYILPVTPFVLIAFEKVLTSKEFKIILPIILLVIYLYAQNFILANTAPIPNLQIFN